jgi:chromosome segregation ATPase
MRHPYKADIGKNEDDYGVCVCVRPPEHSPENYSKQSGGGKFFTFLAITSLVGLQFEF